MAVDWSSFKKHREVVARDEGQWVGLLNENAEPMMDCPPVVSLTAPETRNVPASLRVEFAVRSADDVVHPVVNELVAEDLADVDVYGRLVPVVNETRFIAVQREGQPPRTYRVTHTVVSGGPSGPALLEVHGTDMLAELNRHVAWSAPTTVSGEFIRFERDWAGPEDVGVTFDKPRDLQDVKFVTVADGVTLSGPAEETIKSLLTTSLETGWRATGRQEIIGNPPVVVDQASSGIPSPTLHVRPTDRPLLDTIASLALSAGVTLRVRMWFPGDAAVDGHFLTSPTVVVRVEQTQEVF